MSRLSYAVCTYNRAERLPRLIRAMRAQDCPLPFEVLVIDNNSSDDTPRVLARLATEPGAPLRVVRETRQGISHARNRALAEALDSDYLVFIDDDELPRPGLLVAACAALTEDGVQCVGGRVHVDFEGLQRPAWLGDELLGFLAEVDYGDRPFRIRDAGTPLWTANIAYDMALFRDDPGLRFDLRYNRIGKGIGGGEDIRLFETFLERGIGMAYEPRMVVDHRVEAWRLSRRYFLALHYESGRKQGYFDERHQPRLWFGAPPFLYGLLLRQGGRTALKYLRHAPDRLRQAMNLSHALGMIAGHRQRRAQGKGDSDD
ncbi:glycosyltransferase [Thiohalobacter sp. IOR34]|uniref:glycosyltransferase n=1 Tax=Thiohalobacter sp. IOR34 TaxID=3057176 RepID=UPI0025B0C7A4|nr:glycosyltransferase [Thiohalobacter sp. IOR34]WJW74444.1 glycosyltransferase [Thiohalobacter sp. IOR34]